MASITAFIGWVVVVLAALWVSAVWGIAAFNNLGHYNIGGVPNGIGVKIGTVCALCVVAIFWMAAANMAPFTISLK